MSKSVTFDLLLGEMGRLSAKIGEQEKNSLRARLKKRYMWPVSWRC